MVEMRYTLRPAEQTDFEFLYRLKVECLRDYIEETWGWDEAFQRHYFIKGFDPARIQIVVVDTHDVGGLSIEEKGYELYLAGIYILPAWQNRGLGTAIIQDLLDHSREVAKPIWLQVLKVNPACLLYERLGFEIYGESRTHYLVRAKDSNSVQ